MKIYQVDAFVNGPFTGNPAAVCPLEAWLPDQTMQSIALENNLSETAFYVPKDNYYELRWFTPTIEVNLCGHATMATAFVLFNQEGHEGQEIEFHSPRSGSLSVTRQGELLTLNFPTDTLEEVAITDDIIRSLNLLPTTALKGKTDLVLIYEREEDIIALNPDFGLLANIQARGVIVTAPGNNVDFVSRFFGPNAGVNEDPVTGSAHTSLTPYWSERLGKTELTASQLSARGGSLQCSLADDRVLISGKARLYLTGEIFLD